ncbi:hypothetical protein SH2C18_26230 [Clostridium sediminicola]|uniref:hypothetical protein n=1 Tax=Clostridium sediminicola TaxID=3114879 RepID=UPI0031F266AE
MEKLLKSITIEEFNSIKKISITNIQEGFNNYTHGILDVHDSSLSINEQDESSRLIYNNNLKYENRFINFMKKIYTINKKKPIIVDFYLNNIDNEGILRVLSHLEHDDKLTFINHVRNIKTHSVYFLIEDKELIPFMTRLSTRELHFCTFHFTEKPITIWGNYNLSFPVFFKNNEDVNFYDSIARKNDLFIRDINFLNT